MAETHTFENDGNDFSGLYAAKDWCRRHGYEVGSTQRDAPIGVHRSTEASGISKWRNMSRKEIATLDGRLESRGPDYGSGAVVLTLIRPIAEEAPC